MNNNHPPFPPAPTFRQRSYFAQADEQTSLLPKPDKPKKPDLVRPIPTKRDLTDWAEELRNLALRASDIPLQVAEELEQDIEALEARIAAFL